MRTSIIPVNTCYYLLFNSVVIRIIESIFHKRMIETIKSFYMTLELSQGIITMSLAQSAMIIPNSGKFRIQT